MSSTVKSIANKLRYLSINDFIGLPNFHISHPTKKNLIPRPISEASINMLKLMLNTPAVMVKILYGIGVIPAVNTAQKIYLSYMSPTESNSLCENTLGMNQWSTAFNAECPRA